MDENMIDYRRNAGYTAVLIDGGFYRKRAQFYFGEKTPKERADELETYCKRHLSEKYYYHDLYRVFYYDCPPIEKKIYHPLLGKAVDFSKSAIYLWTEEFFKELKKRRKFAIRLGKLSESHAYFSLKEKPLKELIKGRMKTTDLKEKDFLLEIDQKGVDMKIGLDIASLSYKKQVAQIVLISGDSDFVSAAKLARREGVDFILDPMGAVIKSDLLEHIDGLRSVDKKIIYNFGDKE